MAGFYFLFGNQGQSHVFLLTKLIISAAIFLITIFWAALKYVNDETLNGEANRENQFSKLGSLFATTGGWLFSTIIFGTNWYILMVPKLDSDLMGVYLFGAFALSGFIGVIIAWNIILINVKKSDKTPEEKENFYITNNRTWNMIILGLIFGLIGVLFVSIAFFKHIDGKTSDDFHIVPFLIGVIIFGVPGYLMVKIPKWLTNYARKYM